MRTRLRSLGIKVPESFESKLVRTDGSEFPVEIQVSQVQLADGMANIAFFTDISDRKKAEEEKQRIEEKAQIASRLAAVGEMAAGIAHEINNPLTGVVALSQLMLEAGVPPEMKDDMEAISSEGQRAANVVKNLLAFARSHTLSAQPVEINGIITQVLNLRAYEHRVNNIEVVTHFAAGLPEIIADHFQLQQVFLNIVLNAEQAMIELRGRGNLVVSTEQLGDIIRVSFTDNGPGVPPDIINRIFDPFFTTKEVGKGTGLGLSICYGIVTKLGGRLYARSQPGQGATFVIELPINNAR